MQQAQNTLTLQDGKHRFLAIEVNGHGFGIPMESVREIVFHTNINPLPQTPEFVCGVALIRQETIPVLDLNILLGGETPTPIHHESCFIVIQLTDGSGKLTQVCLLADRILQTYKIDNNSVDSPPVIGDQAVVSYLLGMARVSDRNFVLLDPARLISPLVEAVSPYITYSETQDGSGTTELATDETELAANKNERKNKNKFLSVFINNDEYAFPLSAVSQVTNKSALTDFVDNDVPDILYGAAIFNNKPLGIVHLSNFISYDQQEPDNDEPQLDQATDSDTSRKVIVLVEFQGGLLGIVVDRIGHTYDNDANLKQNSFCNDLQRNRIKSLGFIDEEGGSIEVIDPNGILTPSEQSTIESWMRCVDRMMGMSESKNTSSQEQKKDEETNPLAVFAGSYLVVQVGEELIGLNSADVDEVLTYAELIPLRGGPTWFSGLLDLRQSTYPVIDLHAKLDVDTPVNSQNNRNVLVMIHHNQHKLGLLVDKIIHSTHIGINELHGPEQSKLLVSPEALHAVGDIDSGLVHIINLQQVIEAEEISARRLLEELNEQTEKQGIEVSSF